MKQHTDTSITIEEFLDGLSPDSRTIVLALRDVVKRLLPHIKETMLWGALSYHRPDMGGRIKGAVCMITAKHHDVRLEFIHGVRLADPHRLLLGDLKSKRTISIHSVEEANRTSIAALIRAAARVTFD